MHMTCAFTGHRPERLPWGADETDARCAALKTMLRRAVLRAYARGCRTFLCGMARGCDWYFASAVLALTDAGQMPGAQLVAMVPCPSQPDAWPEPDRARYRALLGRCACVEVLEDSYTEGCMLRRNRAMVLRADLLITVFDGTPGGTAATVRFAKRHGVELLPLWM